jgi:hypothetical protein
MRILRTVLAFVLCLLLLAACDKKEEDRGTWTVLVYMATDNGLSSDVESVADAEIESMESTTLPNGVRVVFEIDRAEYCTDPTAKRYELSYHPAAGIGSNLVANLGEIDSSSPNSLIDFVRWGVKKYPADHTALVIWSHGSGWYRSETQSICPDDDIPNGTMGEMRISDGSFRSALTGCGAHFDLLILDACLMQTMEVLGETTGVADYVLGSEDPVPLAGFPYTDILPLLTASASPRDIAMQIPELFVASHLPNGNQYDGGIYPLSCSVADMSQYNDWLTACSSFVTQNRSQADSLSLAFDNCEYLGTGSDNIDVREFFTIASSATCSPGLSSAATEMLTATASLFPAYDFANHRGRPLGCASMWFPRSATAFNNWVDAYQIFVFADSRWTDMLESYYR